MSHCESQVENPKLRDQLGRRNRLQAQPTGKRVALQARDWVWLEALARHGPLSSSFLLAFAQGHGVSEKRAKERLTDLFNETNTPHGGAYLIRPPQQYATIDSRYNRLVYDLAPAGLKALAEKPDGAGRVRARSGPWLHQFMTSSITASIELAAKARCDLRFIL